MKPWRRGRAVAWIAIACLAGWPGADARAGVRVQRTLDSRNGLPVSFTDQVEQDPEGFLWIATPGGIFRYDGSETRPMASAADHFVPGSIAVGRPLLLQTVGSSLSRVTRLDGTPETAADGSPLLVSGAAVTPDGALWVLDAAGLRRERAGSWTGPFVFPTGAPLVRGLSRGSAGNVLVATDDDLFRVSAGGTVERVASAPGTVAAVQAPDGTVYALCWRRDGGHVLSVRDGVAREVQHSPQRPMSLALRGTVLWVAYDSSLVRIAPGEPNDEIAGTLGRFAGGPLFVDGEGSLWLAGMLGLVQFPEPETVSYADRFPMGPRHITKTPDGFWMTGWNASIRGRLGVTGWDLSAPPEVATNPVCVAQDGGIWTINVDGGFTRIADGEAPQRLRAAVSSFSFPCLLDREGTTWFPAADGLYALPPGSPRPTRVESLPPPGGDNLAAAAITEDRDGEIWIGRQGEVCHAPGDALRAGAPARWSCEPVAARGLVEGLRQMPGGDLWATGGRTGVMRRRAGRWEDLPGARELSSPVTYGPIPSPAGGFWIVGQGNCVRVEERPDLPDGWRILERIGIWQGLPSSWVTGLVEWDDGTLWLATGASLVRVPPEARRTEPAPPRISIAEASVNGQPIDPSRSVELPHDRNSLELRFAALCYREPGITRFRTRLRPEDPWSDQGKSALIRFPGLSPGRYRIEAEASLDGERWSAVPASIDVVVLPAWWATWWFYLVAAGAVAALAALAYRVRVEQLLRLERQRTRIAMDLHDAIGSGLGSIRILAGLAGRETTPAPARTEIVSRIAAVSEDLATALGDIVWSLRPGSGNLESLGLQLLARGAPLFEGRGIDLSTEFPPAWPDVHLSLAVRRHVFLIGIEALHNAARHAAASRVVLAIEPAGRRWCLRVEDDGRGMPVTNAPLDPGHGLGLESIRKRASEIGAAARWTLRPGGGTVFGLEFDAGAEDRRTVGARGVHERATGGPGHRVGPSDSSAE